MRAVTAFTALTLITLLSFGYAAVVALPETPDDAAVSAESIVTGSDAFVWSCSTSDGVRRFAMELSVDREDFITSMHRDVLRCGSVFAPSPSSFIDPDDRYVREIASIIERGTEGLPDIARAQAALAFVQSAIGYAKDSAVYGQNEFWAYPVETLYLRSGDCEDKSILLCSIFGALGFDSILLDFEGHMAAAVDVEGAKGAHYTLDGRAYYYCETTGIMSIGHISPEFSRQVPVIRIPGSDPIIPSALNFGFAWYRSAVQKVLGI